MTGVVVLLLASKPNSYHIAMLLLQRHNQGTIIWETWAGIISYSMNVAE